MSTLAQIARDELGLRVDDPARLAALPADLAARIHAGDAAARAQLIAAMVTGETYFFRHAEQHAALRAVVPANARMLSAGCATGEEPYTLAMLCADAHVDAFDLSPVAIETAKRAEYRKWSLRSTPDDARARYFVQRGDRFALVPEIARRVAFRVGSVIEPVHLHYDVVFCRNVLMYLTPDAMARALDNLVAALAPGGYLFLGYAERVDRPDLAVQSSHDAFYYRRTDAAPARMASPGWFQEIEASAARVTAIIDAAQLSVAAEDPVRRAVELVEKASPEAEAACRALGDTAVAHYLLATCREGARDLPGALGEARIAAERDDRFALAQLRLGLLARRCGDRPTAVAALSRALQLLPGEPADRLALFAGGLGRGALSDLARAALEAP